MTMVENTPTNSHLDPISSDDQSHIDQPTSASQVIPEVSVDDRGKILSTEEDDLLAESSSGLGSAIVRGLVTGLMIVVLGVLSYLIFQRVVLVRSARADSSPIAAVQDTNPQPESAVEIAAAPLVVPENMVLTGIQRKPEFKTSIPERPKVDVITYTVQSGDTLFEIAGKYNIKAETVLWGNFETLKDNPNFLKENQVLNILPVDGTYYQWQEGDTLEGIAKFFKTDAQAIIDFSGNPIDLTTINTLSDGLASGNWIVVPGGKRPIKDWGPPTISRSNPAIARYYGEGSCGSIYDGAFGTGTFIWPAVSKTISGYTYSEIHPGVDIGGALGSPIFAADSGVVVFAGWSDFGYGYMIVVDHGNGFQTAYAHLSAVSVGCGQSVYQGSSIGALGSSGNSSGPHLHFELTINGAKPNPLDYIN